MVLSLIIRWHMLRSHHTKFVEIRSDYSRLGVGDSSFLLFIRCFLGAGGGDLEYSLSGVLGTLLEEGGCCGCCGC